MGGRENGIGQKNLFRRDFSESPGNTKTKQNDIDSSFEYIAKFRVTLINIQRDMTIRSIVSRKNQEQLQRKRDVITQIFWILSGAGMFKSGRSWKRRITI